MHASKIPVGPKAKLSGLLVASTEALMDSTAKHPGKTQGRRLLQTVDPGIVVGEMRKKLPNIKVRDIYKRFPNLRLFESDVLGEISNITWASWAQFSIIGCLGLPNDCGEIGLIGTTTIRTFNVILVQTRKEEKEVLGIEILFIHPPKGAVLVKNPENTRSEISNQLMDFLQQECWDDIERYLQTTYKENQSGRVSGLGSMVTSFSNAHRTQRILATPF